MMNNQELRNRINNIADELFPDIPLDFRTDKLHVNIFHGEIRIACSLYIDRGEIFHSNILNESTLKRILKIRMKNVLLDMKNVIEKDLEKLDDNN